MSYMEIKYKRRSLKINIIPFAISVQLVILIILYTISLVGCEGEPDENAIPLAKYEETILDVKTPRASTGWYPNESVVMVPENGYSQDSGFRLGITLSLRVPIYDDPGVKGSRELFQGKPFWIIEEKIVEDEMYFKYVDFNRKSGWLLGGRNDFTAATFSPMRIVTRGINARYTNAKGKEKGNVARNIIVPYIGISENTEGPVFAIDNEGQTLFLKTENAAFLAEDVFFALYLQTDAMYNLLPEIDGEPVFPETALRADWFIGTYSDSKKSPALIWEMAEYMGRVNQPGKRREYLTILQSEYPDSTIIINSTTGEVRSGADIAAEELPEAILTAAELDEIIADKLGVAGPVGDTVETDDAGLYAMYLRANSKNFDVALPMYRKVIALGKDKSVRLSSGEEYEIAELGWQTYYGHFIRLGKTDVEGFVAECEEIAKIADDPEYKNEIRSIGAGVSYNFPNLTNNTLMSLPKEELERIAAARYARHGKLPDDPKLISHFEQQPWFIENPEFDNSQLTKLDWIIVNGIRVEIYMREKKNK